MTRWFSENTFSYMLFFPSFLLLKKCAQWRCCWDKLRCQGQKTMATRSETQITTTNTSNGKRSGKCFNRVLARISGTKLWTWWIKRQRRCTRTWQPWSIFTSCSVAFFQLCLTTNTLYEVYPSLRHSTSIQIVLRHKDFSSVGARVAARDSLGLQSGLRGWQRLPVNSLQVADDEKQ